jgi:uncharacterized membrane protein
MLLYAFWVISKEYKNDLIFNKFLIGMILQAIANFLLFMKIFTILFAIFISAFSTNPIIPITWTILTYFVVYYILNIVGAYFIKESFVLIKEATNISLFEYAGILIILGAVLKIIGVGFIIEIIGWVLFVIALFLIKDLPKLPYKDIKLIEKKD